MERGIDVSRWQGTINWQEVRKSGITCAIIKAGGSDAGFYRDPFFEENYRNAKANGVKVGAYYFVGAGCTSAASGEADAKRFIDIIKGKQFELPLYIDFEAPNAVDKIGNTAACAAFCDYMEQSGYFAGIYSSDISGFVDRLNMAALTGYSWWVARYGSEPKRARQNLHVWQYSSTGKVPGINGNVDLDEVYVDFEAIIKEKGLNGYTKANNNPTAMTLEQRVTALEERVRKLERG